MLLLDTHNLFENAPRRIDYDDLMNYLEQEYKFRYKIAFVQETEHSGSFANYLRGLGFTVLMGSYDSFDVELSFAALRNITDLNIRNVVICSSSRNLMPLFHFLIENRLNVHVHGYDVPLEFSKIVFARELPKKVLQNEHDFAR